MSGDGGAIGGGGVVERVVVRVGVNGVGQEWGVVMADVVGLVGVVAVEGATFFVFVWVCVSGRSERGHTTGVNATWMMGILCSR